MPRSADRPPRAKPATDPFREMLRNAAEEAESPRLREWLVALLDGGRPTEVKAELKKAV